MPFGKFEHDCKLFSNLIIHQLKIEQKWNQMNWCDSIEWPKKKKKNEQKKSIGDCITQMNMKFRCIRKQTKRKFNISIEREIKNRNWRKEFQRKKKQRNKKKKKRKTNGLFVSVEMILLFILYWFNINTYGKHIFHILSPFRFSFIPQYHFTLSSSFIFAIFVHFLIDRAPTINLKQ